MEIASGGWGRCKGLGIMPTPSAIREVSCNDRFQYSPLMSYGGSSDHSFRIISSDSVTIAARFLSCVPSISRSEESAPGPTPMMKRPGAELDLPRYRQQRRHEYQRRRNRLHGRSEVFADVTLGVAQFIGQNRRLTVFFQNQRQVARRIVNGLHKHSQFHLWRSHLLGLRCLLSFAHACAAPPRSMNCRERACQ